MRRGARPAASRCRRPLLSAAGSAACQQPQTSPSLQATGVEKKKKKKKAKKEGEEMTEEDKKLQEEAREHS